MDYMMNPSPSPRLPEGDNAVLSDVLAALSGNVTRVVEIIPFCDV